MLPAFDGPVPALVFVKSSELSDSGRRLKLHFSKFGFDFLIELLELFDFPLGLTVLLAFLKLELLIFA